MAILGIGIDILQSTRLLGQIGQRRRRGLDRLAARILVKQELDEYAELAKTDGAEAKLVKYLALRWTAKEAAYKALYPNYKIAWKDLQVLKLNSDRKPELQVLLSQAENVKMHLSVSHDGDYITSVVLAEQID